MNIPPRAIYTMIEPRLGLEWELTKLMISRFERTVRLSIVIYLLLSLTACTEKYCPSREEPESQKFLHTDGAVQPFWHRLNHRPCFLLNWPLSSRPSPAGCGRSTHGRT